MANELFIIGFDGPDNVGKDTQIERIRKHFDDVVFSIIDQNAPVGKTIEDKQDYAIEMLNQYALNIEHFLKSGRNLILNRTHLSEYAYGKVFRGMMPGSKYEEAVIECDKRLAESINNHKTVNCTIFVFIDEVENIMKRDDGKSLYTTKQTDYVKNLIDRFNIMSFNSKLDVYVINILGKSPDVVTNEILNVISNKMRGKYE